MNACRLAMRGFMTSAVLAAALSAPLASAQDEPTTAAALPGHDPRQSGASNVDAGTHFRRGVELYGEAAYAGALVEFKRAYAIAPTSAALYNVGEAQFQLQDYAGALKTFRQFLREFGPAEGHRAEVERDVDVLRTRVGHVSIKTVPGGAEITIDDHGAGKTPLDEPVLVSVGHRKVVASMAGRAPVTSYVDVAAEDIVSVTLQLPPAEGPVPAAIPPLGSPPAGTPTHSRDAMLRTIGFGAAGVLAAGAVTFGALAIDEAGALKNARAAFPAVPATISHDANLTLTYSILADSLGVAAIVVGGIALFGTLSSASRDGPKRSSAPTTRVTLGPTSARLEMTF
jgi:hypothetical protein